jgi:adenosylmethionine-8-amino-7-oxononanoate aminotransferase
LFIVDEVVTGFGRTGHMFASDRFGLTPDIMTLAKGLTSGYLPLGAVLVGERVWAPFWEDGSPHHFRHGLTYAGHGAACRAALVNLDILEREHLVDRVLALEPVLWDTVRPLADHDLVDDVRGGVGLLSGVDITTPELAAEVVRRAYEHGMLLRLIGYGRTLQISPPFVITAEEIARLGEVLSQVLDALVLEQ